MTGGFCDGGDLVGGIFVPGDFFLGDFCGWIFSEGILSGGFYPVTEKSDLFIPFWEHPCQPSKIYSLTNFV